MESELPRPRHRRIFLKQVAAVVGAAPLAGTVASVASATRAGSAHASESAASVGEPLSTGWLFCNADEARVADAALARLIPADENGPGAREAGVVVFLDRQLAGAWGHGDHFYRKGPFLPATPQQGYQLAFTPAEMFRLGFAKLDENARKLRGAAFADLTAEQQARFSRRWGGNRRRSGDEPRLAGLPSEYLAKQLFDYRDGSRPNAVMAPIAKALTDAEIGSLALYFGSQPAPAVKSSQASPRRGAQLAREGDNGLAIPACADCHGGDDIGGGPILPPLGAQPSAYTTAQMTAFRSGERHNDDGAVMREMAKRLSDADIQAIASYFENR